MRTAPWPRATVYDPEGGHFMLQYFSPLFALGTLVTGVAAYAYTRRAARTTAVPAPAQA